MVIKSTALRHSQRVTEGCTIRDLELCLGEDHHRIQNWIASCWLRDSSQGTRRNNGKGHDRHRFQEKEIPDFINRRTLLSPGFAP